MNSTYKKQREKSDETFEQGVPLIFGVLGLDLYDPTLECLISTIFQDTRESTDLVIQNKITDTILKQVAYRMRTVVYIERFPLDITFRLAEFLKLMRGAADIGFYGFTDKFGKIVRWILINFNGFRYIHHFDKERGEYLPEKHIRRFFGKNKEEGDTEFWAYRATDFLAHDNNLATPPEHKIILGHSLGYFEDIKEIPAERAGLPSSFIMKDIIDRIDR